MLVIPPHTAIAQSAFSTIEQQGAPLPASVFHAVESDEPSDLLSVYKIALQRDARLAAAYATNGARRALTPQVSSRLLPQINASGSISKQYSDATFNQPIALVGGEPVSSTSDRFTQYNWQISGRQSIIDISAWYSLGSAKALASQADVDLEQAKQGLISRTVSAYLDVLRASNSLEFMHAEAVTFEQQLHLVQKQFNAGVAPVTDLLEAQAAFDDVVVRRIGVQGDQVNFITLLNTLTGYQFKAIGRVSDDFPIEDPKPLDLNYWIGLALERNLEIKSLEFALKSSNRNMKSLQAEFLPKVELSGEYGETFLGGRAALFQGDEQLRRSVRLSVTVPLFRSGALYGRAKEAFYRREEVRHLLTEKRRQVESQARNTHQRILTSILRIKAREASIRSAAKSLEAVRRGYEAGTRTVLDVLQAERLLSQSEFDYEVSRYDYVFNMVNLRQLTGLLSIGDIRSLNSFIDLSDPIVF